VSVIVAVRDAQGTIEACLNSLLSLDPPGCAVELLVVDNGSTDDTARVLDRFRASIRVVDESKRGPAAARNAGIRRARGDRVAFTDADCVVDPGWLRALLPPLEDPSVGIAGGRIVSVRPCNRIERFGERIHDHERTILRTRPPYAITMNWASRREVFETHGFFDERLLRGSDADMAYRIDAAGLRIVYRADAIVAHRNESTLRGLFGEGFVHGRARTARLGRNPPPGADVHPRFRHSAPGRLAANVLRGLTAPDRMDALLAAVFEAGKVAGEFGRLPPRGRSAPDGGMRV
jgi:glycosyltransferase involved in cell wall biosynthesis